jgi:hypothetical protein
MTRHHPVTLLPVALVAIAGLVGACSSSTAAPTITPNTATSQSSETPTTSSPDEPTDLGQIPEDTPLEPGTYSMELLFDDGPTRAIVDVPEGYVGHGAVIGSDHGDMAFWGSVTQVDTDPCLGGKHISAGTSVHDLASLLVAQRHMKTSQPVPVTIGGYHGVYLKTIAPANIDRCRDGSVTILGAGDAWLQLDLPSATFREWILNVNGQRVVGGTRSGPDAANSAELVRMIETAEFTTAGQP